MIVFVTGGSGFVGSYVIEALVAAGHEVRAMARSERSAAAVSAFGATPVICSLGAVTPEHLGGVEAIVHAAAFAEEWGTRAQFEEGNVVGTEQLLRAAEQAGVGRFVHVSTEAALFDGTPLVQIDESHPYPTRQRFLYSETKARAERAVLSAHRPGFVTLALRPRLVWGPRDASVLPAILRMVADGAFAWLDGGKHATSTCYAGNFAHAVVLALSAGRGGQAYFIADAEDGTAREFLTLLTGAVSVQLPSRSIPGWLARPVAAVLEGAWRLFNLRGTPPLTRFAAAMLSAEVTVRWDKARRELEYRPIVTREMGLRAVAAAHPSPPQNASATPSR